MSLWTQRSKQWAMTQRVTAPQHSDPWDSLRHSSPSVHMCGKHSHLERIERCSQHARGHTQVPAHLS